MGKLKHIELKSIGLCMRYSRYVSEQDVMDIDITKISDSELMAVYDECLGHSIYMVNYEIDRRSSNRSGSRPTDFRFIPHTKITRYSSKLQNINKPINLIMEYEKIIKRIKAIKTLLKHDEFYSKETAALDLQELEGDLKSSIIV